MSSLPKKLCPGGPKVTGFGQAAVQERLDLGDSRSGSQGLHETNAEASSRPGGRGLQGVPNRRSKTCPLASSCQAASGLIRVPSLQTTVNPAGPALRRLCCKKNQYFSKKIWHGDRCTCHAGQHHAKRQEDEIPGHKMQPGRVHLAFKPPSSAEFCGCWRCSQHCKLLARLKPSIEAFAPRPSKRTRTSFGGTGATLRQVLAEGRGGPVIAGLDAGFPDLPIRRLTKSLESTVLYNSPNPSKKSTRTLRPLDTGFFLGGA